MKNQVRHFFAAASALVAALSLFYSAPGFGMGRDPRLARNQPEALARILAQLQSTPSGATLLARARKVWGVGPKDSIESYLSWGAASKTDAVLTRSYDPATGEETRKREVRIALREDGSMDDLLLDLAHELVHATTEPQWDPYDPELTATAYVKSALDGPGGEVEAVIWECAVALEYGRSLGQSPTLKRCQVYAAAATGRGPAGQAHPAPTTRGFPISGPRAAAARERVREDFYRVGDSYSQIVRKLGAQSQDQFPLLSPEPARLYSSTGGSPYPLSLLAEFDELNRVACENSERRLASQSHAEEEGNPQPERKARIERFLKSRCRLTK